MQVTALDDDRAATVIQRLLAEMLLEIALRHDGRIQQHGLPAVLSASHVA